MAHNIAPGYCVVQRPGTLAYQAQELFRDTRSSAVSLFMKLNADTQWLIPGQILIVVDPNTRAPLTTHMLTTLRQAKNKTNQAFIGVSSEDASFMQKNYGTIAALTNAGDKIFGTSGDAGEKYFSAIEKTLKKIEAVQEKHRIEDSVRKITCPFCGKKSVWKAKYCHGCTARITYEPIREYEWIGIGLGIIFAVVGIAIDPNHIGMVLFYAFIIWCLSIILGKLFGKQRAMFSRN